MNNKIISILIITMLLFGFPIASATSLDDINNQIKSLTQNLKPLSVYGSDFTINSISSTKVISNDADLQSANFIITTTVNNWGQSIIGTFDTTDFKQYSGYETKFPLQISMGNVYETLSYPIVNQGQVFKYDYTYSPTVDWNWERQCVSGYEYCFYITIPGTWYSGDTYRTIGVRKLPIGSYGSFNNPNINWGGQITMTVNGVSMNKNIGSAETAGSVDFYSGSQWYGNAKWTGSLISGQATPNPNLYKAIYSGSSWKVAANNYYETYAGSLSSVGSTLAAWSSSSNSNACYDPCNPVLNLVNTHNLNTDQLLNQNTKITYASGTEESLSQSTQGGLYNGAIIETTNRRIAYPQIVLTVKASTLGVLIATGKPEIISVSSPSFASGSSVGSVTATVKNTGTATGYFRATFTDPSGTFTPINTGSATIGAGQTGTIAVQIGHGTTAQTISKPATIRVYDYNKPSNYDEQAFTITMTTPKACTPGAKRISGQLVYTCNSDGMGETLTTDCTGGVLQSDYTCKMPDNTKIQLISITMYDIDRTNVLTNAPIIIDGKGEVGKGFKQLSLPVGTYRISSNNISNPRKYAPTPETVILQSNSPLTVSMYFTSSPEADYTWVFWLVIVIVIVGIGYITGWYRTPIFWGVVIGLFILYEIYLLAIGVSNSITNTLANPWLPWNW